MEKEHPQRFWGRERLLMLKIPKMTFYLRHEVKQVSFVATIDRKIFPARFAESNTLLVNSSQLVN